MSGADAVVVIKTKMDNSDFMKQSAELAKQLEKLGDKVWELQSKKKISKEDEAQIETLNNQREEIGQQLAEIVALQKERRKEEERITRELQKQSSTGYGSLISGGKAYNIVPKTSEEISLQQMNNEAQQLNEETKQISANIKKMDLDGVGRSIKNIVRNVVKWGLAVIGIRSAYAGVRNAMNVITQYDKKLAADIQFIKTSLAYTFEPIVRSIVNLMKYLLSIVGTIVKSLTGRDIFAQASKNLKSGASSAKQIEKSMASFDEATTLSKSSSGGASSGTDLANYKFDAKNLFANWNLNDFIEKGKELASNIAKGINEFFAKVDWSKVAQYITLAISGIIAIVDTFLNNIDWTLIGQSIATLILSIDWVKLGKDIIKLIKDGIIGGMNIMEGIAKAIIDVLTDKEARKKYLTAGYEIIKEIAKGMADVKTNMETVWSEIVSFFLKKLGVKDSDANKIGDKMGEGITKGMENAFFATHPIAGVILKVIKLIKQVLGIHSPSKVMEDIGENMADGLKGGIEEKIDNIKKPILSVVNAIIRGINKLIDGINKISIDVPDWVPGIGGKKWGFNIKKIPEVKLAKGGIVNMPGRGVPVGAMAGERGMEGIIPLTDSQQMAMLGEAIGRYITINANIPVNMNGRLISREIRKVQNDNSFATNGGAY